MLAEISTNTNALQEDIKSGQVEMRSAIGAIEEMMNSNQAEMRFTVCAIRSELKETIQHNIRAVIQPIRSELDETSTCNKVTEANTEKSEPDRGMMQSIAKHQVVPKEEAIVKPVKGRKKQRRGQKASCRVTWRAKGTDPK
jgi:hypothetical protein